MRKNILNAFKPSDIISEPHLFAGRKKLIMALADALQIDGSCPVIFGERGVGKSSLAMQAMRIGLGDIELLSILELYTYGIPKDSLFHAFWVSCSEQMKGRDNIVRKIVHSIQRYIENPKSMSTSTKIKVNLKVIEGETTTVIQNNEPRNAIDVEEEFFDVVSRAEAAGVERFLIILDEFDRVESSAGIANFIKSNSSDKMKFILVGIADDIAQLLTSYSRFRPF